MAILGHGIDVADVDRIERLLTKDGDFLAGWFTERELAVLGPQANRPEVVAGCVAAKEAVVKALGTGFAGEVSWQDIEVVDEVGGTPQVALSGGALAVANALGATVFHLSIGLTRGLAVASVIAVGQTPQTIPR